MALHFLDINTVSKIEFTEDGYVKAKVDKTWFKEAAADCYEDGEMSILGKVYMLQDYEILEKARGGVWTVLMDVYPL